MHRMFQSNDTEWQIGLKNKILGHTQIQSEGMEKDTP